MANVLGRCVLSMGLVLATACAAPGSAATRAPEGHRIGVNGATLRTHAGDVALGLTAVGREGAMVGVEARAARELADVIRVEHGLGRTEWWRPEGAGLEHGVTLELRAPGEDELLLEIAVSGALARSDDEDVVLERNGIPSARYAGLVVFDADRRRVPARLEARGEHIVVHVDDRDARYPIVVDPLFHTLEVRFERSGAADARIGTAVAVDTLGTRVLASGVTHLERTDRVGTVYTVRAGLSYPAAALAISGDGAWTLAGVPGSDADPGTVYLAQSNGTGYDARGTLARTTPEAYARFGATVVTDETATFAAVGAPNGASDRGVVTFFRRTGTTWSPFGPEALGGGDGDAFLGSSLAMSADGTRVAAGGPAGGAATGYVAVFRRGPTSFVLEAELRPTGSTFGDVFGRGVALDGDGNTLLASTTGIPAAGSVWAFEFDGTAWAETARIESPGSVRLGEALAIDHAGVRAVASSRDGRGSVRVFGRTGGAWSEAAPIVPSTATDLDFARSVALSGDGHRAVVGIPGATVLGRVEQGTVEVFLLEATRARGVSCELGAQCQSGFCADGVCCDTACGDGESDCQACSIASGGTTNGECTPLADPDVVCRAAAGSCDVEERCTATALSCPDDTLSIDLCRPSAGPCDVAEVCDGVGVDCPSDLFLTGVECRAADGACDLPEVCLGDIATCPPDRVASTGTVCRASTDLVCDPLESCNGVAAACPLDLRCDVDAGVGGTDTGSSSPATGCGCRAGAGRSEAAWVLALGMVGLLARIRRRSPRA